MPPLLLNARARVIAPVTFLLALLLTGCASNGPLGTAEFEPTLRRDIPDLKGRLVYQAPAVIFYGVDGYAFIDNLIAKGTLAPGRHVNGPGVVVLTDERLHFIRWISGKYEPQWEIDYKAVTSLEVRSFVRGRRMVVKMTGEPEVSSFDFTSDNGQLIDRERAAAACLRMAQYAGRKCVLPEQDRAELEQPAQGGTGQDSPVQDKPVQGKPAADKPAQ